MVKIEDGKQKMVWPKQSGRASGKGPAGVQAPS